MDPKHSIIKGLPCIYKSELVLSIRRKILLSLPESGLL